MPRRPRLGSNARFALLTALLVGGILAGDGRGARGAPDQPAGKPAEVPGAKQAHPPARDVGDTHQRIERIYHKLGIEQQREQPSGCSCGEPAKPQQQGKQQRSSVQVPSFVGYLVLGLVFAAMLIPLIRALQSGYREVPTDEGEELNIDDEAPADEQRRPWRVDLSGCRELADRGELTRAFAALHRATLLALQRRGHLHLDEATTTWAYVRALASKPPLRRTLAAVTEAAERAVLGKSPPGRERFDELDHAVSERTRG